MALTPTILPLKGNDTEILRLLGRIAQNTEPPFGSLLVPFTFANGTTTLSQTRSIQADGQARGFRLQVVQGITLGGVLPATWRVREGTASGQALLELVSPTVLVPSLDVYPRRGWRPDKIVFEIELTAGPVGQDVTGIAMISLLP